MPLQQTFVAGFSLENLYSPIVKRDLECKYRNTALDLSTLKEKVVLIFGMIVYLVGTERILAKSRMIGSYRDCWENYNAN